MKKVIIAIIAAIVILAGAFTGLYFFTDTLNFLKPANQTFAAQAKKLFGTEKQTYSDYEKAIEKLKMDKSYSTEGELSAELNLPSTIIDSQTQSLINTSSIKYTTGFDIDSGNTSASIALKKDGEDILNLDALLENNTKLSLASKNLFDKSLTFDLDKYEDFAKKNNIRVDSDTKKAIQTLKNAKLNPNVLYDIAYISKSDYNALKKTYKNVLVDLIDKDNFSKESNQEITVNGDDVKATAYTLTLNGKDLVTFTSKFVDLAKKDPTTKKLIVEKYNKIVEDLNLGESAPKLSEDDIEDALDSLKDQLDSAKEDISESAKNTQIKFTIYSKKNKPVKFEVALSNEDEKNVVVFYEELSDGKNTYTIDFDAIKKLSGNTSSTSSTTKSYRSSTKLSARSLERTAKQALNSLNQIVITDKYSKKTNEKKEGTITISAKAKDESQDLVEINYDVESTKSDLTAKYEVKSPLLSGASLSIESEMTGLDSNKITSKMNLSGKYSIYSVALSSNSTTTKGSANLLSVNKDAKDVFTLSETELTDLIKDVVTQISDKLPSKLDKYGIKITKEDILKEFGLNTTAVDATAITPAA